jgi:GDPmannose 4,6-dehydratase
MKKAIIFGSNGQDGYYLTGLLEQQDVDVIGITKSGGNYQADLKNYDEITELIKISQPDYIFHLAARSTTSHSALFENHDTIVTGATNVLESVRSYAPQCRVFLSGSGLQFVNNGLPIKETDPFEARSAYCVARIHSVYAARYYRSLGLKVYIGYFFNHDSPRRQEKHVSQMIASAVKRIAKGSEEIIKIGNYNVRKEWGYAGDIVKGIWTLVNQNMVFEAIIGTGTAYSIKDWLELCFSLIGKDWKKHVQLSDDFIPEYNILVSDPSLINSLGWKPEHDFYQLAEKMVF